jgi:hypothetical protein
MSYPVFHVPAGDVLPVMFATYAGSTGASVTMTGLAVTDIEIYKDGSVTQRSSDAGYTLLDTDGIDFDGLTGIHGFSIDTGDNTDASFYTVGAWFTVVVSAVTVDSQTVSFIACQFRLMAAEGVAAKPKVDVDAWLGTAAATPTTAGVPEVDVTHWLGTAPATPTTAGIPEVDVTHFNGTAGTFASGRPEVNASHFAGTAYATALAAEVDAVWDEQVDGTVTGRQSMRLQNATLAGKASGLGTTTAVYRDLADTLDRISATVDADGNRTAVTRNVS